MCIPGLFGGGKTPSPAPPPAPTPLPTPSEVSPQAANDARLKQLQMMRFGLASTIKTGARGLTGSGPNLSGSPTGKVKLGA